MGADAANPWTWLLGLPSPAQEESLLEVSHFDEPITLILLCFGSGNVPKVLSLKALTKMHVPQKVLAK